MANSNGKSSLTKTVGIVALGGLADITIEYVTGKFSNSAMPIDKYQLYPADLVGTAAGAAGIIAGAAMRKPAVALFGAGALTAALATLLGKAYYTYNPIGARASAGPRASGFAPPVDPKASLVVGSQGGGHVVYKPVGSASRVSSNVGLNILFV